MDRSEHMSKNWKKQFRRLMLTGGACLAFFLLFQTPSAQAVGLLGPVIDFDEVEIGEEYEGSFRLSRQDHDSEATMLFDVSFRGEDAGGVSGPAVAYLYQGGSSGLYEFTFTPTQEVNNPKLYITFTPYQELGVVSSGSAIVWSVSGTVHYEIGTPDVVAPPPAPPDTGGGGGGGGGSVSPGVADDGEDDDEGDDGGEDPEEPEGEGGGGDEGSGTGTGTGTTSPGEEPDEGSATSEPGGTLTTEPLEEPEEEEVDLWEESGMVVVTEGDGEIIEREEARTTTTEDTENIYDLNKDGVVDLLDTSEVYRTLSSDTMKADFNNDGEVDARDLSELIHHYDGEEVSKITEAPVESTPPQEDDEVTFYFEVPETSTPAFAVALTSVYTIPQDFIKAHVLVDTGPDGINVADIDIHFDAKQIDFSHANIGGSIFTIFQSYPKEIDTGKIHILGTSPERFVGSRGYIGTLYFEPREAGDTYLSFVRYQAYKESGEKPQEVKARDLFGYVNIRTEEKSGVEQQGSLEKKTSVEEVVAKGATAQDRGQEGRLEQLSSRLFFLLFLIVLLLVIIAMITERRRYKDSLKSKDV